MLNANSKFETSLEFKSQRKKCLLLLNHNRVGIFLLLWCKIDHVVTTAHVCLDSPGTDCSLGGESFGGADFAKHMHGKQSRINTCVRTLQEKNITIAIALFWPFLSYWCKGIFEHLMNFLAFQAFLNI